ncbi:MAG TPA: AAA family ATPase [Gemmatimonas sp.]
MADLPPSLRRDSAPDPTDQRPQLVVQTLGAARMIIGGQIITAQSEIAFAILLRLVYSPGMQVARDVLLGELWPGQASVRQRANLRQALYKLRSMGVDIALRGEAVQLTRAQVRLTFSVEREVATFDRDVTRGDEPFGTFVPDLIACSAPYDVWLEQAREVVHGDIRRVLVEVLRLRRERADWSAAEVLSRWILQFDPLNEDATLTLAECRMIFGSKVEAVAILDKYLLELGPQATEIRLPAQQLRRRLVDPKARRRPLPGSTERHFIGREKELTDLTLSLRRARWNDGSAVLLHGPSGIGKTRLVSELGKLAQIEGYLEVSVECRETDKDRPLSVFLEAIPELLSTSGALGCSPESMSVLRRLVGERLDAPALSHPGVEGNSTSRAEDGYDTVRAQPVRNAIVDVVGAVSEERPLLLVIEDAHWMDDESWDAIADLIQRTPSMRVLLVITSRSRSILSSRPSRVPQNLVLKALAALNPLASLTLARAIGEDYAATMDVNTERWIVDAGEGNPLVLRALVNYWIETGEAGGVPPTLQLLLEHRIDKLHTHALRAMQAVGLLGKFASIERIGQILELPNHELMAALEQLQEEVCLSRAEASVLVTHDLIGRTAISRLPSLVKFAIHLAAGSTLENEYLHSGIGSLLVESLYHYAMAGSADRCARVAIRHSADLLLSGRPKTILGVLQQLDTGELDSEIRAQLDGLCGRLELEAGEYGRALLHSPGGYVVPRTPLAMTEAELDRLLSAIDSAHRADALADRDELAKMCASIVAAPLAISATRIRAAEIGLTIAANTCDSAVADACYSAIESNPEPASGISEQRQRLSLLYHTVFGDLDTASRIAEEMVRRLARVQPSTVAAQDIGRSAYALRMSGRIVEAEEHLRLAFTMAMAVDAPKLALYPAWQLAQMHLDCGDASNLVHWHGVLQNLTSTEDDSVSSGFLTAHYCHVAIELGDLAGARVHLDRLRTVLPRIPTIKASSYVIALEIGVALQDPTWVPTEEIVAVALERHRRTSTFGTSDYLTTQIARAMARLGRYQDAHSFIGTYLNTLRRERGTPSTALASTLAILDGRESRQQPASSLAS